MGIRAIVIRFHNVATVQISTLFYPNYLDSRRYTGQVTRRIQLGRVNGKGRRQNTICNCGVPGMRENEYFSTGDEAFA